MEPVISQKTLQEHSERVDQFLLKLENLPHDVWVETSPNDPKLSIGVRETYMDRAKHLCANDNQALQAEQLRADASKEGGLLLTNLLADIEKLVKKTRFPKRSQTYKRRCLVHWKKCLLLCNSSAGQPWVT